MPMQGFIESFNLSVATALVLQRLLDACPECHGDLDQETLIRLRSKWYGDLARNEEQSAYFAKLAAQGGVEPYSDVRRAPEHRAQQTRNTHVKKKQDEKEAEAKAQANLAAARKALAAEAGAR